MSKLHCPKCPTGRLNEKHVWFPEDNASRIKCPKCGAWSMLANWRIATISDLKQRIARLASLMDPTPDVPTVAQNATVAEDAHA